MGKVVNLEKMKLWNEVLEKFSIGLSNILNRNIDNDDYYANTAIKIYREIIKEKGIKNFPEPHLKLARIYLDPRYKTSEKESKLARENAWKHIREAINIDANNPEALMLEGWWLHLYQNENESIEKLEKAKNLLHENVPEFGEQKYPLG